METVSISKFKATCLKLLDRVQRTRQPLLVTRRGEPIAQISPPPPPARKKSVLGCMVGQGQILGDIVSPLDTGDWEALAD